MNKKIIFLVVLVILLAITVGFSFAQSKPNVPSERWEYTFDNAPYKSKATALPDYNRLGSEGWELVGVTSFGCIFKRRLP